jgi:uncharacterized repeat protein (TIGR03803 family)
MNHAKNYFLILIFAMSGFVAYSQILTTLASLKYTNGFGPNTLTLGSDGNFYGTTSGGGPADGGSVFKVTTNGVLTTLVLFNGTNGMNPKAGLTLGIDGNFYGTTEYGGTNGGYGTVFKMTANGVLTTLVSFNITNGALPQASLTLGNDGNFYGTTVFGGTNVDQTVASMTINKVLTSQLLLNGDGTVFKMTTNGVLTTLVSFNINNGMNPRAGLTLGNDGIFYGTTSHGGANNGDGTVFKVTTNGVLTTLVSFDTTNGPDPLGNLTLGNDDNFYGTTFVGGIDGDGSIFKMTTNGALTTVVSFNITNGRGPQASLTLGNDGNFYGTTSFNGTNDGYGTVFKVTTNGELDSLYTFTNGTDGAFPSASLTLGNDGNFYGTTTCGHYGNGTVFKIDRRKGVRP